MPTLREVTAAFLRALRRSGYAYALGGGLAANLWIGSEEVFPTYDVDTVVAVEARDVGDLLRRVEGGLGGLRGFRADTRELRRARIDRFVCPPDVVADIVRARDAAFARTALQRVRTVRLGRATFAVLSPEDVVLYKALAGRAKDVGPIAAIARAQRLERRYLARWAKTLRVRSFLDRALRAT